MKNIKNKLLILLLSFIWLSGSILAEPVSLKAKKKKSELMTALIYINIPILNFAHENKKDKWYETYNDLQEQYNIALEDYLERNYLESYRRFLSIEIEIEKLFSKISQFYIDRTGEMLKNSARNVIRLNIRYNKKSEIIRRFLTNTEPGFVTSSYDPKAFHYSYDVKTIMNNLELGYRKLGQAKKERQRALKLEKYLDLDKNNKLNIPSSMRRERIISYMNVINLSRKSKKNALYIFQLLRKYEAYCMQTNFRENYYYIEKKLDPVFDYRIPPEYRRDASDVISAVYKIEIDDKKLAEDKKYENVNVKLKQGLLTDKQKKYLKENCDGQQNCKCKFKIK